MASELSSNDIEGGFVKRGKAEDDVTKDKGDHQIPEQTSIESDIKTRSLFRFNSDYRQKFDVFLSHSGKQKNFVRQLHRDLTNQGLSCFFDQDRESLPVAEDFSPRIFEAAKTCKIGALLLSKDFLESKWPMLELSAFVEARDITCTNPNLKILPLFFLISPDSLKKTKENDEKWKQLEISRETPAEWHQALKAIRRINGLKFSEGGNEVEFREEIATEIWRLLPTPSPRYHVPCMQGEARMCLEVANFIKNVQPNEERIRIAGLYGIAGQGKTTLGKAFCNFNLGEFEGKVCHLEFSRGSGNPIQNIKLALQYLTRRHLSYVQTLTSEDQAKVELDRRLKGQRVLLVLDNITEESIEEVAYYLKAELGENSCILLCARSVDLLEKHFNIGPQSCMRVPRLEEEEAISILLERAFPGEVQVEDRCFALKCAKRCLFKENCRDNGPRAQTFHPLALKAFGGYLLGKHRLNMSKGLDEIDGMVDGAGDGLDEVFTVLGQAFDDMRPEYRTIFMLLTVYVLPNMSLDKVLEWTAININEEISFIEKAVEDLVKMAFIEEFKSEIRIHDLYIEFAESKANKMERWLWWNEENDQCSTRGLIPKNNGEFELAKLEKCMYRRIHPKYVGNLFALQLVDVENIGKPDLGSMDRLRSITLRGCKLLAALEGMEKLVDLAWLQIRGVHPMFELPELSSLQGLQHLEIDIAGNQVVNQLGDLTYCFRLREINVCCPSLLEFPRLDGMSRLEKVEFSLCEKVKDRLDCSNCVKLQSIVLNLCSQMAASPLLAGCKKLTKLVLSECDAVTACPDVDMPSALKTLELFISSKASSAPKYLESYCKLEHLQLWNMGELMDLPSFKRLSSLTVLKLGKCGIREPPDLAGCDRLEDVYFFTLKKLERFPNFSSLRELKKLSLCNCISVKDPPDIKGCHKLQVFHLLYNDNMKGLSRMDRCAQLEEIQVSWYSKNEVSYQGIDPDSFDEDLEFCLEHFKDEKFGKLGDISVPEALKELQWLKGKTMLVKRYFRGVKLHYSLTAPSEDGQTKRCGKKLITLKRMIDGKVMALPTMARDTQDRDWFNKVEGYFAGKKDIAHASTSSLPLNIVDSLLLPLSPRYPIPPMQGEARMCEEVANFFDSVPTNGKGIRIAGLYGMPGQGKTTLAKAFCNSNLTNFDGKVCYLEFCGGNTLQRQKLFLRYFTQFSMTYLESLTKEDDVDYLLKTVVNGQRVLLVLDNITVGNIDEVKYYLEPDLGENSCILVSARSLHVLEKDLKIDSQSCMHVPRLEEEQAIAILCEMKPSVASGFPAESRDFALKCAKKCSFKEDTGFAAFHPLALKVFGRHLFCKQSLYLSKWVEEVDGAADGSNDVFVVLDKAFDGMEYKCRSIFMLLTRHIPPSMSTEEALKWLAANCNEGIAHTKIAVEDLYEGAFIEEIEPEIRIHDLIKEFAEMNDKDKYDTLDDFVPTPSESARLTEISSSNFSQGSTSSANSLAWLKDSVPPNNPSLNGFKEITGATSQFTSGRLGKSSVNKSNLRGKAVALTVRKLKSFRDFSHHANISTDDISISSRFFSNVSTISTFSFASYKDSVLPDNPIVYELKEIIGVTSQFTSGRLGKSSFYKSNLRGKAVAITVRRLKKHRDFRFGLRQICIAHHARIVNLLGGCCERENVYLVYDFVHGASLGECLRNSRMPEFTVLKTWISRIQIATDVAQALEYLHYYTGMNYVHNHLNSSSIKITEPDYRAKICHVGVSYLAGEYDLDGTHEGYDSSKGKGVSAEITEDEENAGKSNPGIKLLKGSKSMRLTGRQGYMAPEYVCTGIVSRETDVFSFGVILLELMSGHEPVRYVAKANGQLERVSLIETMNKILLSDDHAECIGKLRSWIDPRLKDSFPMGCAEKVARLSAACVDSEPDKRPDMRNVAGQLSKLYIFSQQWSEQLQANKDLITTTFEAR